MILIMCLCIPAKKKQELALYCKIINHHNMPSSQNVPSNMRKMRRFRSSRACANHHPGICSPFIHSVLYPITLTADSEGPDQTARMPSLSAFARRRVFRMTRSPYETQRRKRVHMTVGATNVHTSRRIRTG